MSDALSATIVRDHTELLNLLSDTDYPEVTSWWWENWSRHIIVRLHASGTLIGYAWATWTDRTTLDFHVCIRPEFKGRYWLPLAWPHLVTIALYHGANRLTTTPIGKARFAVPRLLRPLGFVQDDNDPDAITLWIDHGKTEDTES